MTSTDHMHTCSFPFKVKNKIAVVGGDPLCPPQQIPSVLEDFKEYRKNGWGIAFLGAHDHLASYAKEQGWVTVHFGEERVLNPLTNPVLLESAGKRIISQSRQLLDPDRGGITLEVYSPSIGVDSVLQEQLANIYNSRRSERNRQRKGKAQAFITVYDPFALPTLMTYIFTRGPDGSPNGFAALRKLGVNTGFHIDPCIAALGASRGITDLLIFAAMALLNRAGISYLSLGYEPHSELRDITGMPQCIAKLTRTASCAMFRAIPVGGKKAYHDKFRPDESQHSRLYILFPEDVPGYRHSAAVMHVANIKLRRLMCLDPKCWLVFRRKNSKFGSGVLSGRRENVDERTEHE
ncbi:Lysylphosphatidylglycerol biosynthesis bifunctional protein LysX [Pleurostoma richardsiae]|uniref:Lysylphosphatidylglycerol biosynthesis bifunctional protein LysX n=1 Tax=Pleurostoma richardsiae TaxID=41990 RepID=A0AA38VUN9_9PEZI|nr:Lysylphosphatidylglycerol biosynthesis bifunctional protein LysX [Pleurostoma richardsiae]